MVLATIGNVGCALVFQKSLVTKLRGGASGVPVLRPVLDLSLRLVELSTTVDKSNKAVLGGDPLDLSTQTSVEHPNQDQLVIRI